MKNYICAILLFSVIGCSGPAVPGVEQLKKDLVGQSLPTDIPQRRSWVCTVGEVKELVIQQRFTDKKANTDEVHVSVTLSDGKGTAKGDIVMAYKKYEQGWKLEGVNKSGSFSGSWYADNGNGTVTDNYSRFMWVKDGNSAGCNNGGVLDWRAAMRFCEGLTYAGYSDWRLPTREELGSIIVDKGTAPTINTTLFPNTKNGRYWTSESNHYNGGAWYVTFGGRIPFSDSYDGTTSSQEYVSPQFKTIDNFNVRCVRLGTEQTENAESTKAKESLTHTIQDADLIADKKPRSMTGQGAALGAVSRVRSAIAAFYADHEGLWPVNLEELTNGKKYLSEIPYIQLPGHARTNSVRYINSTRSSTDPIDPNDLTDSGGWIYYSPNKSQGPNDPSIWGVFIIDCTHKDEKYGPFMYSE